MKLKIPLTPSVVKYWPWEHERTGQRLFSPVTLGFGILCFILLTSFPLNARLKPCNEMNYLLRAIWLVRLISPCLHLIWLDGGCRKIGIEILDTWFESDLLHILLWFLSNTLHIYIRLNIDQHQHSALSRPIISWYQPGVSLISLCRQPATYSYWYCLWSFSEWIIQYVKDGAEFLFQLNLQLEVWIFREIDLDTTNSYRNNTSQPLNIQPS